VIAILAAGVVDQPAAAVMRRQHFRDRTLHRFFLADVAHLRACLAAGPRECLLGAETPVAHIGTGEGVATRTSFAPLWPDTTRGARFGEDPAIQQAGTPESTAGQLHLSDVDHRVKRYHTFIFAIFL
jgi:hypothetical protein